MSVARTLEQVLADRENGRLAELCAGLDIDLLVLFGSSRRDPQRAGDIDVAYSFIHGSRRPHLDVVNALGEQYGDYLDVLHLDRADPVARYAALGGGEVLVERTPEKFALSQIAAWGEYIDTQKFRDAELERLAR